MRDSAGARGSQVRERAVRAAAFLLAAAFGLGLASPAFAAREMETILQDDALLLHRSDADLDRHVREIRELGVDRVRLTAGWSQIAPAPDLRERPAFSAADPSAYPPHSWDQLDRAVRAADEGGLEVDIDVAFWAPLWATSDSTPGRARSRIDAAEYGQFATAVATRYSGSFLPRDEGGMPAPPPSSDSSLLALLLGGGNGPEGQQPTRRRPGRPLPAVRMYTLWNEPNHGGFLRPQWSGEGGGAVPVAPHLYREMVYAGYDAIKAVNRENRVLVGGMSSTGSDRRGEERGVRPLRFLRELACVDSRLVPLGRLECSTFRTLPGDGLAHHPYSLYKPPGVASRNPDDATISELRRLTDLLGRLVKRGRVAPGLNDVWLTEYGYETNSPVTSRPFSAADQARFLPWSEYLAWRNPHVRSYAQFLLRDVNTQAALTRPDLARAFGSWQTGIFFEDGSAKPAAARFRFGVFARRGVTRRRSAERAASQEGTVLWGHIRPVRQPTAVRLRRPRAARGGCRVVTGRRTRTSRSSVIGCELETDRSGYFLVRLDSGCTRHTVEYRTATGWEAASVMPSGCARGGE